MRGRFEGFIESTATVLIIVVIITDERTIARPHSTVTHTSIHYICLGSQFEVSTAAAGHSIASIIFPPMHCRSYAVFPAEMIGSLNGSKPRYESEIIYIIIKILSTNSMFKFKLCHSFWRPFKEGIEYKNLNENM